MIEFLKLHWMLVERLDGTSPLVCFGDDGGGGSGGGGGGEGGSEGGTEGTEGVDSSDFDGSGLEGGTGGFDSSDFDGTGLEGGTGGSSFEGGSGTEGGGGAAAGGGAAGGGDGAGGGGAAAGGGSPENDFVGLDSTPPAGYADYGSAAALGGNIEQGLGAAAPDPAAAAAAAQSTTGQDFLSSSQNAPSAPGAPDILEFAGLNAQPGKEDKEDKEVTPTTPGIPSIYDVPMGLPSTKELEKEFQQQFDLPSPQKEQQEIPANAMPTSFSAPYGSQQLDINAFVGPSQKDQAQVAPSQTTIGLTPEQVAQSNQWDIGPTTAVNAFGVGPTANPFASTNVWDFPNPTQQAAPPQKEEQNPWDQQQTAFNTFGFNPTTPQGYNMPAAIAGTPTGAPPPDQQVATGPNPVTTQGFIAPNPTTPVTQGPPLAPATQTGKQDLATARDPFSNKDPWNPDYFAPPVGMLMANVPTAPQSSLQEWPTPTTPAAPFGPQAPTQASPQAVAQGPQAPQGQAPPYDPSTFNPASIQSQVPANLFDLPPTQQQTPPNVASVLGRSGQPETPEERDAREALERDLASLGPLAPTPPAPSQQSNLAGKSDRELTREEIQIATNPNLLQPYAPPPSQQQQIVEYNPPAVPGREGREDRDRSGGIFDPNANPVGGRSPDILSTPVTNQPTTVTAGPPVTPTGTAFGPDPQAGNPFVEGGPLDASGMPVGSAPSTPGIVGGGGSGVVQLPQQQRQQLSAQRKKLTQTDQQKRDAITEALMRRDLFAPGVSDFDRLRLQP